MTVIFNNAPGRGMAVPSTVTAIPFRLNIDGFHSAASGGGTTSSTQFSAVTTGVRVAFGSNHQFLTTVRNFIYVYVFGDHMGEFSINGITFTGGCNSGGIDGLSGVLSYYRQKNLAATGKPVSVQLGAGSFRAFLTGVEATMDDPAQSIGKFKMQFNMVPPKESEKKSPSKESEKKKK